MSEQSRDVYYELWKDENAKVISLEKQLEAAQKEREQLQAHKSMANGYRLRLGALLAVCEEYLLWEPRKRGHAGRHHLFSEYVRGERELVGDDSSPASNPTPERTG